MPRLIPRPTTVEAAGEPPKSIHEYVGLQTTGDSRLSVAHMISPPGWSEPWQTPAFDEWTIVLTGRVFVEHAVGLMEASAGQAVSVSAGERVRYSTPEGAGYFAVCLPAFSIEGVGREV